MTATAPIALMGQTIIGTTHYEPDFEALRARVDPDRHGGGRGVGGHHVEPRRVCGRRATRHASP